MEIYENLSLENLDGEEWKTIDGYEDYQVSNFGRVKSFKHDKINGKILHQIENDTEYFYVHLSKNGKVKYKLINRLVYETFKEKLEIGYDAHHINENKKDNFVENLESKPHSKHSRDHNIGKHPSEETRKKLSKSHIGMVGKKHSKETKLKMSKLKKGKKLSEETKKKFSEQRKGESNSNSKLKDNEVWLIKKILNSDYYKSGKITQRFIGKMFGINYQTISAIKNGRLWNHIIYEVDK